MRPPVSQRIQFFFAVDQPKEIGRTGEYIKGLGGRMAMKRNTFARSKSLFTNRKDISTVFTFDLPCEMSAGDVKPLALARSDLANAFGRRNALKRCIHVRSPRLFFD